MNLLIFCFVAGATFLQTVFCLTSVVVGECNSTLDCMHIDLLASCVSGKCHCPSDYFELEGQCHPLPDKLGDACSTDSHCHSEKIGGKDRSAECRSSKCVCGPRSSPINGTCFKKLGILVECDHDGGCQSGSGPLSHCFKGQCQCVPGASFDFMGGSCVESAGGGSVRYGGRCRSVNDCMGDPAHSLCLEICTCRPGFTPSKRFDKCLPHVYKYGEECIESQQCLLGKNPATCYTDPVSGNSSCRCFDGGEKSSTYIFIPTELYQRFPPLRYIQGHIWVPLGPCFKVAKSVGDECYWDSQCSTRLGYAHCFQGKCVCMEGSQPAEGKCP